MNSTVRLIPIDSVCQQGKVVVEDIVGTVILDLKNYAMQHNETILSADRDTQNVTEIVGEFKEKKKNNRINKQKVKGTAWPIYSTN